MLEWFTAAVAKAPALGMGWSTVDANVSGRAPNSGTGSVGRLGPAEEAAKLIVFVLRTYNPFVDPLWLRLGLTMGQLKGIFALRRGPTTISELGGRLQIAQPTASLLVERLVQAGLVERTDDPADRRRALVRLAPEGERIMAGVRDDVLRRLFTGLSLLSEDDLAALIRGLRALSAAAADGAAERSAGDGGRGGDRS